MAGQRNIGPCGECCCGCSRCATGYYTRYMVQMINDVTGTWSNWADPGSCNESCDFFDDDPVYLEKTNDPYYTSLSDVDEPGCVWVDERYLPAPVGGPQIECVSGGGFTHTFLPWIIHYSTTHSQFVLKASTTSGVNTGGGAFTSRLTTGGANMCKIPDLDHLTEFAFTDGFGGGTPPCTLAIGAGSIKFRVSPVAGTWKSCGDEDPHPPMAMMESGKPKVSYRNAGKAPPRPLNPGPGTELMSLLESIGLYANINQCQCKSRARAMNRWGLEGCKQNREMIIGWLREEAKLRKWGDKVKASLYAITSGLYRKINWRDPYSSLVDEALNRWEIKQQSQQNQ